MTATRAALATSTGVATFTPGAVAAPSATPDAAQLAEQVTSERGDLTFRYPAGWSVRDDSDAGTTELTAQAPTDGEMAGTFVASMQNVGAALTREGLREVADGYLRSLFGDGYAQMVSFREEGETLLATVVSDVGGERLQFEIRFAQRPPFLLTLTLIARQSEWERTAPLLDGMARSVAVNSAAVGILPTPTLAVVRTGDGLTVQNTSLYQASTSSIYLVGEVVNGSAQPYEDVQVAVALVGADGATLASTHWPIQRPLLRPGERSPIIAIFSDPPPGWSSFVATASALPAAYALSHTTESFQVSEVAATQPALGRYALTGQVLNVGAEASAVTVTGVLYDEAGRVLAVESTRLAPSPLPSGAQVPFELLFFSMAEGAVARHEILVEGQLP